MRVCPGNNQGYARPASVISADSDAGVVDEEAYCLKAVNLSCAIHRYFSGH
jgi:hypothetical protein